MRLGGCLCGAVRYEVAGEPIASAICHCVSCRKAASAPQVPYVMFPADAFRVTQGVPTEFRSSPPVTRGFCGRCGSPLTYRVQDAPDVVDVLTCSLDDPSAFPPTSHIWAGEKIEWDVLADGLPAYRTTRQSGERV
jgi:hypothetical protein